ncbi:uncharacterized protein LOC123555002 [Mercenaria mercenaria]|uniref:uncharacterized protein LOC123555002 n=1 Tax=Mercenaria mercenaria TaxID=6596 RepID=UPI00234E9C94|nr:uncharacterized protein LOC123555002 [Mercenaria mercenaria]
MEYPGPYCKSAGITNCQVLEKKLPKTDKVTNGLVLELFNFTKNRKWSLNEFVQVLGQINYDFCNANISSVSSKINKVSGQKKSLSHKKKVKGVKNVDDLLGRLFVPPSFNKNKSEDPETLNVIKQCLDPLKQIEIQTDISPSAESLKKKETKNGVSPCPEPLKEIETQNVSPYPSPIKLKETETQNVPFPHPSPITETETQTLQSTENISHMPTPDPLKAMNQIKYEISKQQKQLNVLKSLVQNDKQY